MNIYCVIWREKRRWSASASPLFMTPRWQSALTAYKLANAFECYEIQHFSPAGMFPWISGSALVFPSLYVDRTVVDFLFVNKLCRFSFFWSCGVVVSIKYVERKCSLHLRRVISRKLIINYRAFSFEQKSSSIIGIVCKQVCLLSIIESDVCFVDL